MIFFIIRYCLLTIVWEREISPGALLLIENPEGHLHPSGQATLDELIVLVAYWRLNSCISIRLNA